MPACRVGCTHGQARGRGDEPPPDRRSDGLSCSGTLGAAIWPLHDLQGYMGHPDIQTTMIEIHKAEPSRAEPGRFESAALRWLARFCVERREATLAEVQAAAWAFENFGDEPVALAHAPATLLTVGGTG